MFHALSRRRFVQGLVMGGAAATLGLWPRRAAASDGFGAGAVLDGTEFDLQIAEAPINITGAPRTALTLNGSVPAPTLRWREGDTVRPGSPTRSPRTRRFTGTAFFCRRTRTGCPG